MKLSCLPSVLEAKVIENSYIKVEGCSYEEPRVGNENFASYITQSIPERFRVIHYADIVPHVPPQLPIPYAHFVYEIWYDKNMKTYKQCETEEFK